MSLRDVLSVSAHRQKIEELTHSRLTHIGNFSLDEVIASSRNCENMIGVTQIPLGVAGPLKISYQSSDTRHETKSYYLPLATTEGALVASVSRGCKAILESGGAMVDSYHVGATRGPVFRVANLKESDRLNHFLEMHFDELKEIAAKTSHHLKLKKFISRGIGRYRFVRFVFDTGDAMGMNMATIATDAIVKHIEAKTRARCISLAGNFDIDKKPAWLNMLEGRGFKVWAEVILPAQVLKETLKTTATALYETWFAKCMLGSALSGSLGFNAHFANVVAALFIAIGQDPAHVVEASLGITTMDLVGRKKTDLYVSIFMPAVMVGTVGGGTGLATQQEALSLLGLVSGDKGRNAERLAKIVGGAVLAGETSLLASLAEGTLAKAHQKLGRVESRSMNQE